MSLIKVIEVTKTYRGGGGVVEALKKVSLEIIKGEFLALMGPSGSGKSTLLSILGGLNPPTSGKLIIDDIDVYSLGPERLADFRHEYVFLSLLGGLLGYFVGMGAAVNFGSA